MISFAYTRIDTPKAVAAANDYAPSLPNGLQQRMSRFRRKEDRTARTLGWRLVEFLCKQHGLSQCLWSKLVYSSEGRPYFSGEESFDFNLSHSGQYVVCATCTDGEIGVDIEAIHAVNWSDFEGIFQDDLWKRIKATQDPCVFFDYWTRMESVAKADGRGLSAPLKTIEFGPESSRLDGCDWHLKAVEIDAGYACHIACKVRLDACRIFTEDQIHF